VSGDRIERVNFLLTIDADQPTVVMIGYFSRRSLAHRGRDVFERRPHIYRPSTHFAGIRNLQIDGLIVRRGEFRAESTRIDLHRLWMQRFDEDSPRIMKATPTGMRDLIIFATGPDPASDAGQWHWNVAKSNCDVRVAFGEKNEKMGIRVDFRF
jgi:hypothetical protein